MACHVLFLFLFLEMMGEERWERRLRANSYIYRILPNIYSFEGKVYLGSVLKSKLWLKACICYKGNLKLQGFNLMQKKLYFTVLVS